MVAPALGLLAGLGISAADSKIKRNRMEQLHQDIGGLLGTPRTDFEQELFPGEQPIPGLQNKGTGLMDDPFNPQNQARFAAQLMTLPGQQQTGASLLGQIFGQQQQAQTSMANGLLQHQLNADKFHFDQLEKMRATEKQLRGEYNKGLGDFAEVQTSYKDLSKLSGDMTGASALGMVYRFIKSLDPRGIVTDSEGNQVLGTGGAAEMFAGLVGDIKGKGKLTDTTRAQIVNTAGILYETQLERAKLQRSQFRDVARKNKADESQVLTGLGIDWALRHQQQVPKPPTQQKIFQGQKAAGRKEGEIFTDPRQPGWEFKVVDGRLKKRRQKGVTNPPPPMPGPLPQ